MPGSAETFDPDKPEFSIDLPRKLVGPGKTAGAEPYRDDDVPTLPGAQPGISVPAYTGRGSVTPLRANPMGRHEARSADVQTPPPLAKPLEKKASVLTLEEDDLSEMIQDIPKVDVAAEIQKDAAPKGAPAGSPLSTSASIPSELDKLLIDRYGITWLEWTPETLWQTLRMDYGVQISSTNQDKIMAVLLLHVSSSFWAHWETFEKVILAFNNVLPHFDREQGCTVAQMAYGAIQANEIRQEPFQPEVLSYVAVRAREEGFLWLPGPLSQAQARLDALNPQEMVPLKREIQERWEAFKDQDLRGVELKEDVFGVHLAKLAAIDLYLKSLSSPDLKEDL